MKKQTILFSNNSGALSDIVNADQTDHDPSAELMTSSRLGMNRNSTTYDCFRGWFFYCHARNTPEVDEISGIIEPPPSDRK